MSRTRRPRARIAIVVLSLVVAACTSVPGPTGNATAPPVPSPASASPGGPTPGGPTPTASPSDGAAATGAASGTPPGSTTPSPVPSRTANPTPKPTPTPTPRPTPKPTPRPTPTPAPVGWNPNHVAVSFSTVATVPGRPLAITNAGDGSGRLFVAEQGGRVFILKDGAVLPDPFLDVSGDVSGGSEQGLLGIAFHPDFPADHRVFVDYTDTAGTTTVSSFTVDPAHPDVVVPGSESVVITIAQPFTNHNGGTIQFGPDGFLYVAMGDGGSGGDPGNRAQTTTVLLGKILRIDVDHAAGGKPYAIPASNPFGNEIWQYGLRNPFRFSFDRSTGDLWIGDVGQNAWEEIDVARAGVGGLNFGWRIMEGDHCYNPSTNCSMSGLTLPVTEYPHTLGCAVIGGVVYRGSASPALRGGYLFADECSGNVWALDAAAKGPQALVEVGHAQGGIAGFGESESGEVYAAILNGRIYRVTGVAT